MLSYIKGIIKNIDLTSIIILTESGIGYELHINELIYSHLVEKEEVELYVYHSISENGQSLFGFLDFEDRVLFKELIKISGVGGRVAQAILALGSQRLKKAILEDDKKTIESAKGVGKKMAEKIVLELSDKEIVKNYEYLKTASEKKPHSESMVRKDLKNEIISTLTLMGYNAKRVEDLLDHLPEGLNSADTIIPYVIKNI